jgi:hypothetical protein
MWLTTTTGGLSGYRESLCRHLQRSRGVGIDRHVRGGARECWAVCICFERQLAGAEALLGAGAKNRGFAANNRYLD